MYEIVPDGVLLCNYLRVSEGAVWHHEELSAFRFGVILLFYYVLINASDGEGKKILLIVSNYSLKKKKVMKSCF